MVQAPTRLYRPKFSVGTGDDQLFMFGGENTQALRILFQSMARSLISEVEQRRPAVGDGKFDQLRPLLRRWIDTGRVMAAAVEQHHIAGRACFRLFSSRRIQRDDLAAS